MQIQRTLLKIKLCIFSSRLLILVLVALSCLAALLYDCKLERCARMRRNDHRLRPEQPGTQYIAKKLAIETLFHNDIFRTQQRVLAVLLGKAIEAAIKL